MLLVVGCSHQSRWLITVPPFTLRNARLEDKNVVTQTLHILFSVKLFPLVIETQWIQTHKSA